MVAEPCGPPLRFFTEDMMNKPDRLDKGKKCATAQENRMAALLGGRRVPASGALGTPGDVRTEVLLIECKYTEQRTLKIALDDIEKIARQAADEGLSPAMVFELAAVAEADRDWVLLPLRAVQAWLCSQRPTGNVATRR